MSNIEHGVAFRKQNVQHLERDFDTFTVTIEGGPEEYRSTIESLLDMISSYDGSGYVSGEFYHVCNLIKGMLPSFEQLVFLKSAQQQEQNMPGEIAER